MVSVPDERIQPALHALLAGNPDGLRAASRADSELINAVWNSNTLLEWVTQPPHGIGPNCVSISIGAGAHLDRALGLAGCWDLVDLCAQLLDAGADPTSHENDVSPITPLESAAMHGSTEAVDVLVAHGLHRPSLWLAAAAGQLTLVEDWASVDGELLRHPGPYRPIWSHVGLPEAPQSIDDPEQILGEALVLAAANGRVQTLDYLLAAGVSVDSAPYRGITGLHFAVQFAKPAMVDHLIDCGASLLAVDDEWAAPPTR